jgi:hypothetical protein
MFPYNLFTLSLLVATTTSTSFASILPSTPVLDAFNQNDNANSTGSLPPGIDLLAFGIKELEGLLGNGSVTSVQLVDAYLANIERVSPIHLHAYFNSYASCYLDADTCLRLIEQSCRPPSSSRHRDRPLRLDLLHRVFPR